MISFKKILNSPKAATLIQFIKFGLVGFSNTLISYGIEMLCFYVMFVNFSFSGIIGMLNSLAITGVSSETVKIILTTAIAFVISVTNSYYWNNRYVFGNSSRKSFSAHLKQYFKTFCCYGITGLILSPVLKVLLSGYGVAYWLASITTLIVTIPLNFVLNKFWAFGGKKAGE